MDYGIQLLLFAVGVYSRFILRSIPLELIYAEESQRPPIVNPRGDSPPGIICDKCAVMMFTVSLFLSVGFSMMGFIAYIVYMRRVATAIEEQSSTLRKLTTATARTRRVLKRAI